MFRMCTRRASVSPNSPSSRGLDERARSPRGSEPPFGMVKIHVTHGETKRIIEFQKGGEVKELCYRFLQDYSDVLLDQVAPANVKFQRYDKSLEDYVELKSDEKIEKDIKILALPSKQAKQILQRNHALPPHQSADHLAPEEEAIWYLEVPSPSLLPRFRSRTSGQLSIPSKFHEVVQYTTYRLWSPVSREGDGLMQLTSNNNVYCNGSFSGGTNNEITTGEIILDYVSLSFNDSAGKRYVITATGSGPNGLNSIKAIEDTDPLSDSHSRMDTKFVPDYYWGYTLFRKKGKRHKYLGCDGSGNTLLVEMSSTSYPNPQALFILNEVS